MASEIELLDELLLAAISGQEMEVAGWMARRQEAVQRVLNDGTSLAEIEELADCTRRLEDRFLHWRRSSIMELSLIERHLGYLREQRPGSTRPVPVRIDISA